MGDFRIGSIWDKLTSVFDELLVANRRYASRFDLRGIPAQAAKGFSLVTCMDSRIEPIAMLGLRPGDAKILRNAGGRVTADVLRSLVLASTYLGVRNVAVMHHSGCALAGRGDAEIRAGFTAEQTSCSQTWDFLTMPDPDAALAADVHAVRTCAVLPRGVRVEGWRYDVETGLVDRVITADSLTEG